LTHPFLPSLDEKEIIRQVEQDRLNLSEICGYNVECMAYPCGGVNNDDRVADIIRNNTGVRYSRTITLSESLDRQSNLFRFDPYEYVLNFDRLMQKGEKFVSMKPDKEKIFYVWGHAYEMDYRPDNWMKLEEFFKLIAGKDDIFYGTNKEILLA